MIKSYKIQNQTLRPPSHKRSRNSANLKVKKTVLNNVHGLLSTGYRSYENQTCDKIKCNFFQAAVVLILLYGCTTWMLIKRIKKKLDGNHTRKLRAISNKSWKQHPTKQQLYDHLISKTIQRRRKRHAGHCWRSKDKLISDILLWTPSQGRASVGWPTRNYQQQLCTDTGCSLEDQLEAMDDRVEWWERERERERERVRVKEIRGSSATWWWLVYPPSQTLRVNLNVCAMELFSFEVATFFVNRKIQIHETAYYLRNTMNSLFNITEIPDSNQLVLLFKGISTFVGYLTPRSSL